LLTEIEPDFINSFRTATGQNVAFVNLNGAFYINVSSFRGFYAPFQGFKSNRTHHQIPGKKKRSPKAPLFQTTSPDQASFL
jgi:hypothetical protein